MAGAFFTMVVAIFGSLWPAIALHALIDLGSGIMAWLALREGSAGSRGHETTNLATFLGGGAFALAWAIVRFSWIT